MKGETPVRRGSGMELCQPVFLHCTPRGRLCAAYTTLQLFEVRPVAPGVLMILLSWA